VFVVNKHFEHAETIGTTIYIHTMGYTFIYRNTNEFACSWNKSNPSF
jgi:hypothetical protein